MGAILASASPTIVVEDQMEDTVESTELGVRYNSGTVTAIGNLVKTSSELVLGVQHSKNYKIFLRMA
jgi:hypothetical protein